MNRVARFEAEKAAKVRQELIDQGMTVDQAAEHQATEARIAKAIAWLQGMLFSEEQDYIADSNADAADRHNGINPMSEEYLQQVNAKRLALGIPALALSGFPTGNESHVYCEVLVRELSIMLKR
ncbi:hypothetical protein [Cupriavidus pauculus]|uniref:Uncharacterized protein n=1 Tax=Cupriavidus pauculus TaxID=82633 RepID=A0A3G8GYD7_9BURK|nr:hypothetical protein [Cupriavidus pauculus]AZG13243.1 hypothetical protein EHF44_07190 [Cupriavidus pauculus]